MYRKVSISKRVPEEGKPVITIDNEGNSLVYKRWERGWNMVEQNNNGSIEYWLEEVPDEKDDLKILYEELKSRIDYLENLEEKTTFDITDGCETILEAKIHESKLALYRVSELLLKKIK